MLLLKKTNGEKVEFGGSFEGLLRMLEREGVLRRSKQGRRLTVFAIDTQRIRQLLLDDGSGKYFDRFVKLSFEDKELNFISDVVAEDIVSVLDASIASSDNLADELKIPPASERRSVHHTLLKDTLIEIGSTIESRLYDFYFRGESGDNLSKDALLDIARGVHKIAAENFNRPFEITAKYAGLPEDSRLNIVHGPAPIKTIVKNFRKWAEQVLGIKVQEEDVLILEDGITVRSRQWVKPYYDMFYDLVVEYRRIYTTRRHG